MIRPEGVNVPPQAGSVKRVVLAVGGRDYAAYYHPEPRFNCHSSACGKFTYGDILAAAKEAAGDWGRGRAKKQGSAVAEVGGHVSRSRYPRPG
jgi:hypothetical protein